MVCQQASLDEPLIIQRSKPGNIGHRPPQPSEEERRAIGRRSSSNLPRALVRESLAKLPEVSEPEVIRHFTRLSQETYAVDLGTYPLGSCTMKYNPKIAEAAVQTHKLEKLHPEQEESTVQGIPALLYNLSQNLAEITGMSKIRSEEHTSELQSPM